MPCKARTREMIQMTRKTRTDDQGMSREWMRAMRRPDAQRRLDAELIATHAEAHRLIEKLATMVDAIDPDNANWGDVGTLTYYVEKLREITGEIG